MQVVGVVCTRLSSFGAILVHSVGEKRASLSFLSSAKWRSLEFIKNTLWVFCSINRTNYHEKGHKMLKIHLIYFLVSDKNSSLICKFSWFFKLARVRRNMKMFTRPLLTFPMLGRPLRPPGLLLLSGPKECLGRFLLPCFIILEESRLFLDGNIGGRVSEGPLCGSPVFPNGPPLLSLGLSPVCFGRRFR